MSLLPQYYFYLFRNRIIFRNQCFTVSPLLRCSGASVSEDMKPTDVEDQLYSLSCRRTWIRRTLEASLGLCRGLGGMTMSEQGREQNEGDRQKVREMRSGERT